MHTYIHTYIHTYVHTYIHAYYKHHGQPLTAYLTNTYDQKNQYTIVRSLGEGDVFGEWEKFNKTDFM